MTVIKLVMMVSHMIRGLLFFVLALCLYVPQLAFAQSGAGIGLAPATIEEPAEPGSVKQYSITVSNLSEDTKTIFLFKRDIVDVRNGGVPVFANENAEITGFELSEWVELNETEIEIEGGGSRQVSFTLRVPEDATPGSHFGGIFASVEPPRLRASGAGVGYEVANILSIRVAGEAVENAQLRSFSTDNYIYGEVDVEFAATIRNQGNVLVRPIGPLEVFNMFGKRVALLNFNEREGGVFPGRDREFVLSWKDEDPGFGRYQAVLSLSYGSDGSKKTIYNTISFWVLPMDIIAPALAVLSVLLLGTYFGVRAYVRRTIAMQGTRRIIRPRVRRGGSLFTTIFVVMLMVTVLFLIVLLLLFA